MTTCSVCSQANPDGARFCNACGSPLQADARPAAEERKIVTIAFVDLVGFTAQSEALDPEDVRGVLAPYHERVRSEFERYGGTVEKFIGDAVMAVFGAPTAHEDDPERAVRAALAIRDWAAEQQDLQVRIAVNTGEALVNLAARPSEGEAMVAGDVVNTAARLQSAAPVNGVLVGEAVYRATRDAVEYRAAPAVDAKGKAEPVAVWEAVDSIASAGVDVLRRPRTPLVGRDRELELLRSLLARVREENASQLVTLVGVPGIGKSRLVGELFALVDADPELIRWRQGRCLPYGDSVTFWALGEIVKAEAGILESDAPEELDRKLRAAVGAIASDDGEADWLEGELRALVGADLDHAHGGGVSAAAWRRFIEGLAERGPTVLVFEDLHWADEGMLDFVDELVDRLRDVPLLVVGTARPELLERRQAWGGGKANATTISLQPLGEEDTARLVSTLLERPLQLAEEQRTLLERAGGNPLFAEQFVRMLFEQGTSSEVPESVQGVIAARLDALPRREKDLLHEASVHGKVFWVGVVSTTLGIAHEEADDLLRSLERKDFVRRERRSAVAGETQYAFQHVLLRDVAYGQIPRRTRAEKHLRAARWIEGLGRPDDHAELLAHHYAHGLELGRAAGLESDPLVVARARDALRAAGRRAFALSAYTSADAFMSRALELTPPDDPVRPAILLELARAVFPLGRPGAELLDESLRGFEAQGDLEGACEAATVAARFAWFAGDRTATDVYMAKALDLASTRPDSKAGAEALTNKCGFEMLMGNYDESIRIGRHAQPLVEALGLEGQRARIHIVVGTSRASSGDFRGVEEIEQGLAIARAAHDYDMATTAYANLTSEYHAFGRLGDARRAWEGFADLCERFALDQFFRNVRADAAGWAYVDGRWDEAVATADGLIELSDAGNRHWTDAGVLALRAWIRLARGDAAGAQRDSALAAELARASDAQAQVAAFAVRAAIALAGGDRRESSAVADELVAWGRLLIPACSAPFPAAVTGAWAFRDLGRAAEYVELVLEPNRLESPWVDAARAIAAGDFVRAGDVVESIGNGAEAAYARLRAADALAEAGRDEEAAAQRAQGERFAESVGAVAWLAPAPAAQAAPSPGAATR